MDLCIDTNMDENMAVAVAMSVWRSARQVVICAKKDIANLENLKTAEKANWRPD